MNRMNGRPTAFILFIMSILSSVVAALDGFAPYLLSFASGGFHEPSRIDGGVVCGQ